MSVISSQLKVKTLVANSQSSMPKLQRKPNSQIPTGWSAAKLTGAWELALPWDLVIGHWTFHSWRFFGIWILVIGTWIFSAIWILVFGVFIHYAALPSDRFSSRGGP